MVFMRFLMGIGAASTPKSMLSLRVTFVVGGKERKVDVPKTFWNFESQIESLSLLPMTYLSIRPV